MEKILVVDNEVEIGQLLLTRLTILGYKVYLASNEKKIGYLSASTWSPTLQKYVGYVRFDYPGEWKDFKVKVQSTNDNFTDCEIVDLPFYDKEKLIPKGIDRKIP